MLEGKLRALNMESDRMRAYFGKRHGVNRAAMLEKIARVGVLVGVAPEGGLKREEAPARRMVRGRNGGTMLR